MCRWTRMTILFLLGSASSCAAAVQDADKGPTTPPPEFARAKVQPNGEVAVVCAVFKPVWETRTREIAYTVTREVNGKTVSEPRVKTQTYQVCRMIAEAREKLLPAGKFWATRDGARLDAPAVAEALRQLAPIVIYRANAAGSPLDPFYQQFLKPGVIVVGCLEEEPRPPVPGPVGPPASAAAPTTAPAP